MKPTDTVKAAFALPFKGLALAAKYLAFGWLYNQHTGAKFAKNKQLRRWLSPAHTGLLLDGADGRLSETESFQNLCLIARIGAGKTSRFIIPNVLDRIGRDCSMVINDPKGEVFAATSGAMQRAGYQIAVLDPENPSQSSRFNPLLECRSDIELEQIAEIIITAGNPVHDAKDSFWNNGAIRVLSLLLKCLRNTATTSQPGVLTLSNALYLLQNFGSLGRPLDTYMAHATINPLDPTDRRLWHEWKGILTGNPEGIQSFVLNALTALRSLSNQNLAWMTAASDIQLQDLRRRKTVLYLITPPQHAHYYAFLVSMFMQSVFNAAMRQLPGSGDLPIYVLYDEFGHGTLPGFAATANTIRAYKVSISVVLQSIAQLKTRYGKDMAQTLLGGFNTLLTYAGSDPETCAFFETVCGRVRERQRKNLLSPNPQDHYHEFNLLNADEVRTLRQSETIAISTNRDPMKFNSTAFFESRRLLKMTKIGSAQMPVRHATLSSMPVVRI